MDAFFDLYPLKNLEGTEIVNLGSILLLPNERCGVFCREYTMLQGKLPFSVLFSKKKLYSWGKKENKQTNNNNNPKNPQTNKKTPPETTTKKHHQRKIKLKTNQPMKQNPKKTNKNTYSLINIFHCSSSHRYPLETNKIWYITLLSHFIGRSTVALRKDLFFRRQKNVEKAAA